MSILMCRPDHFGIEFEINPWMHMDNGVDRERAARQWQTLYDAYVENGENVELVEPVAGLPDMVFTANAAVIWQGRAVISRFKHPERQGEERHFRSALEQRRLTVIDLPPEQSFEGAGDALFVGARLFAGWGFRTEQTSHARIARSLDVEVISLHLVDPRFYHLDTCFSPLDESTVLIVPEAFDEPSLATIRREIPTVIDVSIDLATGFACNAVALGRRVYSSAAAAQLSPTLTDLGFSVTPMDMTEFMKSGGGVRCLSLPLDTGTART